MIVKVSKKENLQCPLVCFNKLFAYKCPICMLKQCVTSGPNCREVNGKAVTTNEDENSCDEKYWIVKYEHNRSSKRLFQ